MKFSKSSEAITRGYESKITLRNKTLGLHFQISNPTFFLSLSHFGRVPSVKLLFLKFCYQWTLRGCLYENGNKLPHPYWPGDQKLFLLHVYLQGMPHQFERNIINAFYNKFWNQIGKFLKHSWFFAFGIWKKRRLYVFNLLFLSD